MKVTTFVRTEQEVEVDVSLDDVIAEIAALDAPSSVYEALRLVSVSAGALRRLPAEIIALCNDKQRSIIHDALVTEAARWAEGVQHGEANPNQQEKP